MKHRLAVIGTPGEEVFLGSEEPSRKLNQLRQSAEDLQKTLASGKSATVVTMTPQVRAHLSEFGTLPDSYYL